ncbi:putative glucan 1,3-beta-glucosidase D [Mycena venus]|uniref:Putative glucan 1,3-beta-glucosidase D n=1 Tax=Mycena venus TaxID=2733690 RepID=A0A8H7CSW8_9AGAR|nr:putative glucan 1,3-beta-glucosidase D [Mycena venus]
MPIPFGVIGTSSASSTARALSISIYTPRWGRRMAITKPLSGLIGDANTQRMLGYIRVIVEFISQSEYKDLLSMFGIVNEAYLPGIERDGLTSFHLQAQHDPRHHGLQRGQRALRCHPRRLPGHHIHYGGDC